MNTDIHDVQDLNGFLLTVVGVLLISALLSANGHAADFFRFFIN